MKSVNVKGHYSYPGYVANVKSTSISIFRVLLDSVDQITDEHDDVRI